MSKLTRFQRDLLYAMLNCDAESGVQIRNEIEKYYESELSRGQVYSNLDILVSRGLVEKADQTGRTNEYSITNDGINRILHHQRWVFTQFQESNAANFGLNDLVDGRESLDG